MEKKQIPEPVRRSFEYLTTRYGGSVSFVGQSKYGEVYSYIAPADVDLGFPNVCVWDGAEAVGIGGFEALDILRSMSKQSLKISS